MLLDGILVVSADGRILLSNKRFAELWGIPDDVINSGTDEAALAFVGDKLRDPKAFIERSSTSTTIRTSAAAT